MEQVKTYNKKPQTVVRIGIGVIVYNVKDQTVLMSRRKDTSLYAHPGGHLEMFETIKQCCQRELQEETNIDIDHQKFSLINNTEVMRQNIGYHYINYFMGTGVENAQDLDIQNLEPHKHDDWEWISYEKLQSLYENNELFFATHDLITFEYDKNAKSFYENLKVLLSK